MTQLLHIIMRQRRWFLLVGACLFALAALLEPTPAQAACGVTDPGACMDAAIYSGFYALASLAWLFVRTLLIVAYSVGAFQTWIVQGVFPSAYAVLVEILSPFVVPLASLAVLLGALSFLVLPWWGEPLRIVNLRRALVWVILVPLFFAQSGAWIGGAEQMRATTAQGIYAKVAEIAPGSIFGASAGDLRSPTPLYPANPCGMTMTRAVAGVQPDDMAAALAYADAADIHCPAVRGPDANLPDAFFIAKSAGGPGYGVNGGSSSGGVGDASDVTFRQNAIDGIQQGNNRLWLALLPAGMAIVAAAVNLLFALALLVTWVGLPIALLFVFFVDFAGGFSQVVRRAVAVIVTSWSAAVVQGIVFGALDASARSGNAATFTAVCVVALFLQLFLVFTAGRQLLQATSTVSQVIETGTGLSLASGAALAGGVVGTGADLAMGAATGGAALAGGALTAASAARSALRATRDEDGSGGNQAFALGAALGTSGPLMRVGEIATTLGALDSDGDVVQGLDAGARYANNPAYGRETMRRASRREGPDGSTLIERGTEQHLVSDAAEALHRGDAVTRDAAGVLQTQPRVALDERPADAMTVPTNELNVGRLLRGNYTVQQDADSGTTTFWPTPPAQAASANEEESTPAATASSPDAQLLTPAQQHTRQQLQQATTRIQLIKSGGLRGSLRTAKQTVAEREADVASADALARGDTLSGDLTSQMERLHGAPMAVAAGEGGSLRATPVGNPPAFAHRAPKEQVDQDQLVGLGYTVQPDGDVPDNLVFFRTALNERPTDQRAQAEERAELARQGAIRDDTHDAAHAAGEMQQQEAAYDDGAALAQDPLHDAVAVQPRATPPAHALTRPATMVKRDRLLELGYTVQRGGDDTVQFWRDDAPVPRTPTHVAFHRAQEAVALLQAGALSGDERAADEALFRAARQVTIADHLDGGQSVWMDGRGGVQAGPRWHTLPPSATITARERADVGRLLAAGQVVQMGRTPDTVVSWLATDTIGNPTPSPDLPARSAAPTAPDAGQAIPGDGPTIIEGQRIHTTPVPIALPPGSSTDEADQEGASS